MADESTSIDTYRECPGCADCMPWSSGGPPYCEGSKWIEITMLTDANEMSEIDRRMFNAIDLLIRAFLEKDDAELARQHAVFAAASLRGATTLNYDTGEHD